MKKIKKISYFILFVIVIILALTVYTNANKESGQNERDKAFTEIRFLESKIIDLLNTMNNLEMRNYKISFGEISKSSKTGDSSSQSSSGNNSSGSSNDDTASQESKNQENTTKNESTSSPEIELKRNTILGNTEDINWDNIKSEVENLYESIPTITLDLYKINLNQEDILSFNKEFDNLTIAVENENKQNTLDQLTKLYDYIPKFAQNATDDELYKKLTETKTNIFKAYSKLDSENWNGINDDINNGISVYSAILTDTNINSKKQYSINRVYIMLNELRNTVNLKDKSVFLIKYKNLVEEIDNL